MLYSFSCAVCVFFPDKLLVVGRLTASALTIMVTVNMAPMSPKTSWTFPTTPPRRLSGSPFPKVYQNPLLTPHISVLQPPSVDPAPQVEPINRTSLGLFQEGGASLVSPAWRN